mmetsp:Transcript_7946/g.9731  ORF Transcript_7946/g.9731 Transcript_7946/m.9731 type:complete len:145 (-) Transcript_7946:238-672(-)
MKTSSSRINDMLIPARFLATMGHLIAVIMANLTINDNIDIALSSTSSDDDYNAAKSVALSAIVISYVCFTFDFVGLFGGFIFFERVNCLLTALHCTGSLLVSWFIVHTWQYRILWTTVGLFNVTAALVNVCVFVSVFMFKTVTY